MTILWAGTGALALVGAGFGLQRAIGLRGGHSGVGALSLAWLLGCGAVAWVLMLWADLGGDGRTLFPWLLTAGGLWGVVEMGTLWRSERSRLRSVSPAARRNELLALILLAGAVAGAIYVATASPMLFWDERFTWAFKGKILFYEGSAHHPAFLDPERIHIWRDYPLLIPYIEAFVAWAIGTFDDAIIKFVFPCFFFSMVMLVAWELRDHVGGVASFLVACYLACLPGFLIRGGSEGGSYLSGFADLPLAAYALASFLLLERFRRSHQVAELLASALCIACVAVTKREGLVFVAPMGIICVGLVLARELDLKRLVIYWGTVALFVAPFEYFHAIVPEAVRPDSDYWQLLEIERLRQQLANGEVLTRYLGSLFGMTWGFIGVFAVMASCHALAGGSVVLRHHWPLLLYCVAPFSAFLLAFHATPFDATTHLDQALLRLQSQFVPLWCFGVAAILLRCKPEGADLRWRSGPTLR